MSKKSLSHHLSRRDPDDTELDAAMKEFVGGSDRVGAIMGSAMVENSLMSAIRTALVEPFDDNALFHDQAAPFGTFKARIVAGRALGLFGKEMAEDLDAIRDIRNQFAHALLSINFENPHIVRRCAELREHKVEVDGKPVVAEPGRAEKIPAARFQYERACWGFAILLIQKERELLEREGARARAELQERWGLENVGHATTLADLVTASVEGGTQDVKDDITPDKTGIED